jgi:glutaredoxin
MKKDTKIYLSLVVIVFIIIIGIYYFKNKDIQTPEEGTMNCIASKTTLYSQTICSHCKQQKEILGSYSKKFNIIECDIEPSKCMNIAGTPTWKIGEEYFEGVKSIKELSELTSCKCNANINVIKDNSQICNSNDSKQTCTIPINNICEE